MSKPTRMQPEDRRAAILKAATTLARKRGYGNLLRDEVARTAKVANGLVTYYFETIEALRKEVLREAIKHEDLVIVGQAIAINDPLAKKAPSKVREAAIRALL